MPFIVCIVLNGLSLHFRQQELSNLLHEKNFLKALGIAISLDQPHTVLRVIKGTVISHYRLQRLSQPRVVLVCLFFLVTNLHHPLSYENY